MMKIINGVFACYWICKFIFFLIDNNSMSKVNIGSSIVLSILCFLINILYDIKDKKFK